MKTFLKFLALAVAVILAIAAIMPKDFKIEKEITVNKPVAQVFSYLKMSKNFEQWSPWAKKDPNMKKEFKGQDGTVGFVSSWSGNREVGAGEQEITQITENEKITYELRFTKPMKATNHAYLITESVGENETKVVWGMTGRTPFPFNLICFFMHGKVESEFAMGLKDLKMNLEK
jgi:uncharacterized protein YndB with AHSA1/START domain